MVYQNEHSLWCRKCPNCNNEITFKQKGAAILSETLNRKCSICAKIGRIVSEATRLKMRDKMSDVWSNRKKKIVITSLYDGQLVCKNGFWVRICPTCKRDVSHTKKDNAIDSFLKNRECSSCCRSGSKSWSYKPKRIVKKRYLRKKPPIKKFKDVEGIFLVGNVWIRKCPSCKNEISYTNHYWATKAHKSNTCCYDCVSDRYESVPEREFMDYMKIDKRQHQIGECLVDGIKDGVVYEFLGDFWHGNPRLYDASSINRANKRSFGELYTETLERFKKIHKQGYRLNYIWESDWLTFKKGKSASPHIQEFLGI